MIPIIGRLFPAIGRLDLPNTLTGISVIIAVITMWFVIAGRIDICAMLLFVAVIIDHLDGYLARTFFLHLVANREFGKHLDTLADLLNFSVVPTVVMIGLLHSSSLATLAAVVFLLSSVLRLVYFTTTTSTSNISIGLPTTYSGFILANVLLLIAAGHLPNKSFPIVAMILSVFQISNIPIRNPNNIVAIIGLTLIFAIVSIFCFTSKSTY